jgi:AcrR family transcriptional regulator
VTEDKETRRRILEHATDRFLAHGFRNVSTAEISRELGMSKKTLYRHFASKEDLLRQVVFEQLGRMARELEAGMDGGASFLDSLERQIEVVGGMLTRLSETFLRDMARHAPGLWREIEAFRREHLFGRMKTLIRRGIEAGVVRPEVDARLAAELLVAMANELITPRRLLELGVSPAEVLAQIGLLVSGGLLTPSAQRPEGGRQ